MSGTDDKERDVSAADLDETAAAWFHRLAAAQGLDAAETRRLSQRWIEADPEHADAFARTAAIWHELDEYAATPEMMALRQAAITDARATAQKRWFFAKRIRPIAAAWLIGVALAGIAAWFYLQPSPPRVYATEIGELHTVTLADNSRVDIDADSAVSVEYTPERRLLHLIRGQAYFQVEKDPARPFIVESNGRNVIATGTAFNVEALARGVRVTLVQGHVLVRLASADPATAPSAELSPNDQLTDETGAPPRLVHLASTLAATAWREGKLLFNDTPLSAAAAEVQRYSHFTLVADPSVADLRIGGAFDAGDVRAFVDAITAYYPVTTVSDRPGELRLVRRK